MGWVEDEYRNRQSQETNQSQSGSEVQFESREHRAWSNLVDGLEQDLRDFKNVGGDAVVRRVGDTECRVSNPKSGIAVNLRADLEGHTIHYDYEPESEKIAVPEGGVLTLRPTDATIEIYSADQRLSSEEARRLLLEPLLFPRAPMEGLEPTGT